MHRQRVAHQSLPFPSQAFTAPPAQRCMNPFIPCGASRRHGQSGSGTRSPALTIPKKAISANGGASFPVLPIPSIQSAASPARITPISSCAARRRRYQPVRILHTPSSSTLAPTASGSNKPAAPSSRRNLANASAPPAGDASLPALPVQGTKSFANAAAHHAFQPLRGQPAARPNQPHPA